MRREGGEESRGFPDDGWRRFGARIDRRRAEKTVGKFLIPHNLQEFIFGERASERAERCGDGQLSREGEIEGVGVGKPRAIG